MSIGWFIDMNDADAYFTLERLDTDAWDDLGSGTGLKDKAITQAYNRLYYDPRWELPTYAEASATDLVRLRKANGEMAVYLVIHLSDEDRRKGIQAQGVTQADIVGETYAESMLMEVPVPPAVIALLSPWSTEQHFGAINLVRDEDDERIRFS